jgi:hypothetical protein
MGKWRILAVVAVAAALLGLRTYRRSTMSARNPHGNNKPGNEAKYWGVRISAPHGVRVCARVQELLGKEFPLTRKPALPLPDCSFPQQCQCRYVKLRDSRKDDRRSDHDRRAAGLRFEPGKLPLRSGEDRRKK